MLFSILWLWFLTYYQHKLGFCTWQNTEKKKEGSVSAFQNTFVACIQQRICNWTQVTKYSLLHTTILPQSFKLAVLQMSPFRKGLGLDITMWSPQKPNFPAHGVGRYAFVACSWVVRKLRRKKRVVQLNPSLCLGSQLSTDPYLKCL